QAYQQRAVFNRDHIAAAGKLRRRTSDKYDRFSGEGVGFAEVGGAISGVQTDFCFIGWRKIPWGQAIAGRDDRRPFPRQSALPQSFVRRRSGHHEPACRDGSILELPIRSESEYLESLLFACESQIQSGRGSRNRLPNLYQKGPLPNPWDCTPCRPLDTKQCRARP